MLLRGFGRCGLRELLRLGGAALEALHATTGVDQLLLARVEGVTLGAELHSQRGDRRAGRELVATRAVDLALDVIGVDLGLHDDSSVTAANAGRSGFNVERASPIPPPEQEGEVREAGIPPSTSPTSNYAIPAAALP